MVDPGVAGPAAVDPGVCESDRAGAAVSFAVDEHPDRASTISARQQTDLVRRGTACLATGYLLHDSAVSRIWNGSKSVEQRAHRQHFPLGCGTRGSRWPCVDFAFAVLPSSQNCGSKSDKSLTPPLPTKGSAPEGSFSTKQDLQDWALMSSALVPTTSARMPRIR